MNKTLEKMWEIEKLPLDETPSSLTRDEARAIERINECMKYDTKERRFVTGLLWRDHPDLCNNYLSAKARLDTLLRRLRANPELKRAYVDAMQEYMDMRVVEIVIDPKAMESSRKDLYFSTTSGCLRRDADLNEMSYCFRCLRKNQQQTKSKR